MNHTPGPWTAVADGIVSSKTGQVICVFTHSFPGNSDECAANELLIKAAPDLLEALIGLADPDGSMKTLVSHHKPMCGCGYCVAFRAIAKATSKTP